MTATPVSLSTYWPISSPIGQRQPRGSALEFWGDNNSGIGVYPILLSHLECPRTPRSNATLLPLPRKIGFVHRIPVDAAVFENPSNAYLLSRGHDDEPITLLDTGVATDPAREDLLDGLSTYELSFSDIDQIILTHFHYDHAGLAGEIQAESGATVWCHPDDAGLLGGGAGMIEMVDDGRSMLTSWGIPNEAQEELESLIRGSLAMGGSTVQTEPITHGEQIELGDHRLEALHLPGHTKGQLGFVRNDREIFTGDALLPGYTANVGGADLRVERPLSTFLHSLKRISEHNPVRVWPGHGEPIENPGRRIDDVIRHHQHRTSRVYQVLSDLDGADVWTTAQELFGPLSGIHILHGTGETYAHLDLLERHGIVERTDQVYVPRDVTKSIDSLFDKYR